MHDAAVLTAIYGGYDELKPACPQTIDCEWVLVTDDLSIPDGHLGWRVVHEPKPGMHPCRAAKAAKFRPWDYTDAPASVWVDGSLRVGSASLAADVLAAADPVAQFAHRDRDCLFTEAAYSAALAKYAGEPLGEQADSYFAAGHPEHWGLWTGGLIARHHVPAVIALGERWSAEVDRWSFQDQVSEPYVLRKLGLRPARLPGDILANPWVSWAGSEKHTTGDLLVILPVRGRPANLARFAEAFCATAKTADLLVVLDADDRSYDSVRLDGPHRVQPRKVTGPKVNAAVMDHLDYRAVMFMGDDNLCVTPGWDEILLSALDDMGGTGICYPNDLSEHTELPCSAMLSSDIVRALGWMCEPSLAHFFVDNVWGDIGRGAGCLRRCGDAVIEHLHPNYGKAPGDSLYSDAMRLYWRHDKAAYAAWKRDRMAADVATVRGLRG